MCPALSNLYYSTDAVCQLLDSAALWGGQDDMLTFERFDFLKLRDIDEVKELINQGYTYGQRVVAQGNLFEALESVRHGLLRTPDIGLAP